MPIASVLTLYLSLAVATVEGPRSTERLYTIRTSEGQKVDVAVPWFTGGAPGVARRANHYLHIALFGVLPRDDERRQGDIQLDYNLASMELKGVEETNQGRTFVVSINEEACGAYCSQSEREFHFDSTTGAMLVVDELLLPDAGKSVAAEVIAQHALTLKRELARVKKELKTASGEGLDFRKEQLDLYQGCLERITEPGKRNLGYPSIGNGGITFAHGECASHAQRNLEELGPLKVTYRGKKLRSLLTPYGRHLILGEPRPAVEPLSRLYAGTVGSSPVTMLMGPHPAYFYDKYGLQIQMVLKRSGSTFELTEAGSEDKPGAVMRLEQKGSGFSGIWNGNGKQLPVTFKPLQ